MPQSAKAEYNISHAHSNELPPCFKFPLITAKIPMCMDTMYTSGHQPFLKVLGTWGVAVS